MGRIANSPRCRSLAARRVGIAVLSCVCFSGCREKPDQAAVEYNGAAFFTRRIGFYERQFPETRVTNLQQVFLGTDAPYSDRWHHYFLRFGGDAGFKSSFFEKYVFPSGRITNRIVTGEIVMLNAKPFPDQKGTLGRIICTKTHLVDTGWMVKWYSEEQVQEIFREAGQKIPPAPDPIPPPSEVSFVEKPLLHIRVENYFGDITLNWGLGKAAGKYLMLLTFAVGAIVAVLLCLLGWRKWGRRD